MNLYPITIAGTVLALYMISFLFTRKSIMTNKVNYPFTTHRKIWNIIMLLLFLSFAPIGFLLALNKVYYIGMNSLGIISWHANIGIAFMVIAIFHVLWHINYYKKGIRKLLN